MYVVFSACCGVHTDTVDGHLQKVMEYADRQPTSRDQWEGCGDRGYCHLDPEYYCYVYDGESFCLRCSDLSVCVGTSLRYNIEHCLDTCPSYLKTTAAHHPLTPSVRPSADKAKQQHEHVTLPGTSAPNSRVNNLALGIGVACGGFMVIAVALYFTRQHYYRAHRYEAAPDQEVAPNIPEPDKTDEPAPGPNQGGPYEQDTRPHNEDEPTLV